MIEKDTVWLKPQKAARSLTFCGIILAPKNKDCPNVYVFSTFTKQSKIAAWSLKLCGIIMPPTNKICQTNQWIFQFYEKIEERLEYRFRYRYRYR